jgi:3-oxoacyl-[acyl-carrier protein] reductase
MDLGLDDKVALITGGSKGIGRATAMRMLNEGAQVLICGRSRDALDDAVRESRKIAGARIAAVQADLTNPDDISLVAKTCLGEFGRIDILVNNAGSAKPGRLLELGDEVWWDDYSLKLFGYVRMTREVMPHLQKQRSGVIIHVLGGGGLMPSAGYLTGGSVNAALLHFAKAMADEGAPYGVRSVGVNPGPIDTERYRLFAWPKDAPNEEAAMKLYRKALAASSPLGRPGRPEEVADLIAYLASPRADFITGTSVTIDGGNNRHNLAN